MPSSTPNDRENWTTVVRPVEGWFDLNLHELIQYRDLLVLLVRRDFVAKFKQTVLGPLWFLIQPLAYTLVFTVVFGRIAKIPTDGLPPFLFYMTGNVAWTFFSGCFLGTSNTFVANAGLFGKVYFPRVIVPVSILISGLFQFAVQFCLLIAFMIFFSLSGVVIKPTLWLFVLPLWVLAVTTLALGVGLIVSSATRKYRDLTHLVSFGVQLWMFVTPIVYPMSACPEKWRWVMEMNPMASLIEVFRYALLGNGHIDGGRLACSGIACLVCLFVGLVVFNRTAKTAMDTV